MELRLRFAGNYEKRRTGNKKIGCTDISKCRSDYRFGRKYVFNTDGGGTVVWVLVADIVHHLQAQGLTAVGPICKRPRSVFTGRCGTDV